MKPVFSAFALTFLIAQTQFDESQYNKGLLIPVMLVHLEPLHMHRDKIQKACTKGQCYNPVFITSLHKLENYLSIYYQQDLRVKPHPGESKNTGHMSAVPGRTDAY